jgi:hypothetical protein
VLSSPVSMAGGASVAATESPSADVLNPAASGAVQRTTFDASYLCPGRSWAANPVWGMPSISVWPFQEAYGVWTGQLGLIHSPFDALSWGTLFTGRLGMAKELTDELLLGVSVDTTLGSKDGFGWGLAADLGAQGSLGQVGFMNDFRWGVAIRNLGKAYSAPGVTGISGSKPAGSFDSPFTPVFGASADLLEAEKAGLVLGCQSGPRLPDLPECGVCHRSDPFMERPPVCADRLGFQPPGSLERCGPGFAAQFWHRWQLLP